MYVGKLNIQYRTVASCDAFNIYTLYILLLPTSSSVCIQVCTDYCTKWPFIMMMTASVESQVQERTERCSISARINHT